MLSNAFSAPRHDLLLDAQPRRMSQFDMADAAGLMKLAASFAKTSVESRQECYLRRRRPRLPARVIDADARLPPTIARLIDQRFLPILMSMASASIF